MDKIKDKCFNPTKASFLFPPDNQFNYTKETLYEDIKNDISKEKLAGLIFNGILNVSQIFVLDEQAKNIKEEIRDILNIGNNIIISIPINKKYIEEKLSLQEILADIVLYQLITGDGDRNIFLTEDFRTQTDEYIVPHNCRIYTNGIYSIFDIYMYGNKINKKDVLVMIYKEIKELFGTEKVTIDDIYFLLLSTFEGKMSNNMIGNNNFFERLLLKTNQLLERYEGEEGKTFFLEQISYSLNNRGRPKEIKDKEDIWFDEDLELYNNIIYTLNNIKYILSHKNINKIFLKEINSDFELIKNDLKILYQDFKEIVDRIKNNIFYKIENILKKVKKVNIYYKDY